MATPPRPSTLADNSPQWASGCPTCMAIWLQFSGPESAPDINLGSYEEALSTAFPRHKELIQEFVHYIRSEEPNSQSFDSSDLGFRKPRQGFSISISQSVSGSGHLWNSLLVKKDDVPEHPGNGRVLDTDWVDIGLVKKWKHRCISFHGVKCGNPLKVWPTCPAWLVGVQKQCAVPGHEPVDYVAISYTYGSHTPPVVTSTAFKGLQKPFALATPEFSDFVSPIIRHFMYLTSAIDERYLWADALCVTHHDPKAASEQLRSMGAIYVNAVATIIATDGDSRSEVPGLKGISNPRGLSQNVIPFGDERLILRNTSFLDEIILFPTQRQHYYQRGRTIQEYALANRKIIFNNLEIHWISEKEYVEEAFPITEWYTSRLPTDPQEQRRKVRPSWFEKREGYKDFTKPMPPGWKRVPVPESEPRLYPDGCSRYLFEHESMLEPYGRLSEWYCPFPVSEIQESTAPFMPEQTPYLFCETVQARLSGYQQDSDKLQYPWDNESKLCDRLGKDIGKLHIPNKETRDPFPENVNGAEIDLPVDIVAVCRLKRCSKTWDREHWETRLPIFKEDLYLLLWVEWKDGIAYRVASGEVIAAEWENLDLEKVSLVLG
ncbi:hypothetical protein FOMG_08790 [Fusarium oxysporum f. sp. melonis 26406]|uniref:Heterokaryon incompatibility domain-containing protein n=1 Tax=Fusarium oxysporum f. sp. melonis 26406 TaxID=1089452 RepID=X0ABY8_FUSOX|nr:hypothetical protein FOMG_08790 [Fusarium oxysporum f. sp. melonis 26406]